MADMKLFATILFFILFFTEAPLFAASSSVKAAAPEAKLPQTANDYFQLGFSAAGSGQYDVAIKNYTQAIEIDPNRIYFFYHRGLAYKSMGDRAKATVDFHKCVAMKPIAEAYYELGLFKYEELDLMGARDLFEKAKALKEDVDKLNYYLGVIYYRINKYDTADVLLTQFMRSVKTNADAYMYLAMVKVKKHQFNDVGPLLRFASLYNDNDWKLHLKMYDIYKEMGDKDNMLAHISMVIEMGQTKPEYYKIRAQLYTDRGEDLLAGYDFQAAKSIK